MIYRVETDEYRAPVGTRLYVDSRFLKLENAVPLPRKRRLPPREQVAAALRNSLGSSYVWGGNLRSGVPELAEWFYGAISPDDRDRLTLAGLDCSGLLYQATGGWTPRNTSQLVAYGNAVAVAGRKAAEIIVLVEPLDLIVWNGHVVIVLDHHTAIESRLECGKPGNGGVVATPLAERLLEIMRTRRPIDAWPVNGKQKNVFVIRRWYGL
jgi:cell wall-associated NlpC family hydrolase